MTRQELHEILKIPYFDRYEQGLPILEWEKWAKRFQHISSDLAMKNLMKSSILMVKMDSEVYYFGLGLEDCENITLKELKELYNYGSWYVYTWVD